MPGDYSRSAGYEGKSWTMSCSNETEEVRGKVLRRTKEDRGGSPEGLEEYDLPVVAENHNGPAKEVHDTKVLHHDLHEDHIDDHVNLLELRRLDHLWGGSVQIRGRHLWDDYVLTWI